jgi:O-antigen ligase
MAINNIITITPNIPTAIYALFFFLCFIIGMVNGRPQFFILPVLITVACVVSIFINDIPSYFKAPERFISFMLIFLCVSPMIYTAKLSKFRIELFRYSTYLIALVVVLSVLAKFTGIYSGTDDSTGLFQGFTNHSMILGPFAAITLLYAIWKIDSLNNNKKIRNRYIVLSIIAFLALLLAGSRVAVMGAIGGVLVMFAAIYRKKLQKFVKLTLIFLFVLVSTSPLWFSYAGVLIQKNNNNLEANGFTSSRADFWTDRIEEFKQSPIFGIGFSSAKYGEIDTTTGQIEPATSWGAIFAQIGILGGLPFLLMIIYYIYFLRKNQDKFNNGAFLLGLLSFFVIHWFAEGYILASGDFLFFYSWLLLSVIDSFKKNEYNFGLTAIIK